MPRVKKTNRKNNAKKMDKSQTYFMGIAVIFAASIFAAMMFLMVVIF